ncbi:VOC family protein [Rapidithrix thailandica]|uniref:VOC family protein n=1 Tax=Rapidithrix thailandica TaxID=413964 RepID=A0AAW9S0B0_9BACT
MKFTRIKETCLYVQDLDRTQHFYQEVLGFDLISRAEKRHVFFRVGHSVLLCFLPEATSSDKHLPPHYALGKIHLAFECPEKDYEQWKVKLQQKDIAITHEHHWWGEQWSFYFEDPDGHVLEVVKPGLWGD